MMKNLGKLLHIMLFAQIVLFSACGGGLDVKPKNDKVLTLKFDKTKIKCKKGSSYISSGTVVNEGEKYEFEAQLEAGKWVEKWFINDKEQSAYSGEDSLVYTIKASDANSNGEINVRFTEKEILKYTLIFDETKIKCIRGSSYISSGTVVNEGERYEFNAQLKAGKRLEKWFINDAEQSTYNGEDSLVYTIKLSDANTNGEINVRFTEKEILKYTVKFDEDKIKCREGSSYISSGTVVNEGDEYVFKARTNKRVEKWFVNDKEQSVYNGKDSLIYTIEASDANSNGEINVRFTEEGGGVVLKFDEAKIKCKMDFWNVDISSGAVVNKDERYVFEAQLETGKMVEKWFVNDKEQSVYNGEDSLVYTIKLSDANTNGEINVRFTEKDRSKCTLNFDEAKIKCRTFIGFSPISSGTVVNEGEKYLFEALVEADKWVEKWFFNDAEKSNYTGRGFLRYRIDASDANTGGEINIRFTEKDRSKCTLKFDEAKIKCCTRGFSPISSGTVVNEGEEYIFDALLKAGERRLEKYFINDQEFIVPPNCNGFIYIIEAIDANASGEINVRITTK